VGLVHDQKQPASEQVGVLGPNGPRAGRLRGTEMAVFSFLAVAATLSLAQATLLLRDAGHLRDWQAGRIGSWQPVSSGASLLALIDLSVLAVTTLVLLATFAERSRHTGWGALVWVLMLAATVLEWRLLGLHLSADGRAGTPVDPTTDYAARGREALEVALLCAAATGAVALALRRGRDTPAGT
jgi:hypothetical protein